MSKWLLPIALLFLLGLASGIGFTSSGSGMTSGTGMSSSGSGMISGSGTSSSRTGLSSGAGQYTPWQEGAIEGLKLGFQMGKMYALADQGQNISGFNVEVDKYNAWVRQNFGNDQNLMMPKKQEPTYSMQGYVSQKPTHSIDASFNRTPVNYGEPLGWV